MAELQGIKGIPTEPQLRKPSTYTDYLEGLKGRIFKESVMEPGFIESLTAPEGSPIDYQNISSVAGGRAREMFVDPMRRFGTAIDKGMTGKPLTIGDQLNLIEGMIDTTVGGLFQHSASKGFKNFDPNTLHMFVGPKAKDIVKAEKMAMRGASPEEIQSKMLMHKKPDGMWRKEISDVDAAVHPLILNEDVGDWSMGGMGINAKETMKHPELYGQYPEIAEIPTAGNISGGVDDLLSILQGGKALPSGGSFSEAGITLRTSPGGVKPVMTHELQHAVQKKEGWARGGSPDEFTQADEADLARDALSFRKELDKQPKGLDSINKENNIVQAYHDSNIQEYLPSREARDLAHDRRNNPDEQLQELVNLYQLDKRTGPAKPFDIYQNLLGEREARSTAERLGMSLEERRGSLPDVGEGATVLMR